MWVAESAFLCAYYSPHTMHSREVWLRTRLFVWHKISSEICTLVVMWVAESAFLCAYYSPHTMHSREVWLRTRLFVWHKISSILSAVYRLRAQIAH